MSKRRKRRILGEHFNPRGRPKLSFDTRRAALAYAAERNQAGHLIPYRCTFCPGWHLRSNRSAPAPPLTAKTQAPAAGPITGTIP